MLLVIGAEAAVVGAAPPHRGVVGHGHLRRLQEDLSAPAVVVHVVGHEYLLGTMLGAALQEEDAPVLEDDLALDLAKAGRADRDRDVVEEVRPDARGHLRATPGAAETPDAGLQQEAAGPEPEAGEEQAAYADEPEPEVERHRPEALAVRPIDRRQQSEAGSDGQDASRGEEKRRDDHHLGCRGKRAPWRRRHQANAE